MRNLEAFRMLHTRYDAMRKKMGPTLAAPAP